MTTPERSRGRRTLIIVENLAVPFDRRVWQEAKTLRAAGYEVNVICPTGKGWEKRFEEIDGVHIHRYKLPMEGSGALGYLLEYAWALLAQFWLAMRVYRKRGFDILHACNPPDNIFLIALCFKPFGVRFLFDHHDIGPELYEAKFGKRGLCYRLMLLWERWTFRCADASIATNESYRQIAIERGGMDPENVVVVRSGPDLQRMRRMDPVPELRNGRRFLVGYVGVMGAQEGIDLLLESVRYIVRERERHDVHFTLVGGGTELQDLKTLANSLGVAEYVTFTGRVPDEELLAVLNTADVCVNPDRANAMNDKSTMNKIMEYMALGKPIVQFDLKEGRVSAQEASLYARRNDPIDFAEKLLDLLDAPEQRASMGAYGERRLVEKLSWDYEAPKLLRAYDLLFGDRQPAKQPVTVGE